MKKNEVKRPWENLPYLSGEGRMSPSLYVLYGLVDDFGNNVNILELSYSSYISRYLFFNEVL